MTRQSDTPLRSAGSEWHFTQNEGPGLGVRKQGGAGVRGVDGIATSGGVTE
jgi:hypothetical protein